MFEVGQGRKSGSTLRVESISITVRYTRDNVKPAPRFQPPSPTNTHPLWCNSRSSHVKFDIRVSSESWYLLLCWGVKIKPREHYAHQSPLSSSLRVPCQRSTHPVGIHSGTVGTYYCPKKLMSWTMVCSSTLYRSAPPPLRPVMCI